MVSVSNENISSVIMEVFNRFNFKDQSIKVPTFVIDTNTIIREHISDLMYLILNDSTATKHTIINHYKTQFIAGIFCESSLTANVQFMNLCEVITECMIYEIVNMEMKFITDNCKL